jgi:hypothetical protein
MRIGKPSPALVVAIIALFVAAGGTAYAATGSLINITDPVNAAQKARVDTAGRLNVGDGSGALTIDGSTTSRESPTNLLFRSQAFPYGTCSVLATPPAGRALIIKSIAVDVVGLTSPPGGGTYAGFWLGSGSSCESFVMDINPPGVGLINQPFEPGLAVPAGKSLMVYSNAISSEVFAFGYSVPASAVPAAAAVATTGTAAKARSMQQR